MNYPKRLYPPFLLSLSVLLVITLGLMACNDTQGPITNTVTSDQVDQAESIFVMKGGPNVVAITTEHNHDTDEHYFNVNTDEVPEGWTRFRLNNATHVDHFYLLYKVPQAAIDAAAAANESILDHWYKNVTAPFQEEWNPYYAGSIEFGEFVQNLFGAVLSAAPWFVNATAVGGPGITAAGITSETTIYLSEGTYIAECYVKDGNGEFHSYNGMLDMLEVTGEASGEKEPKSTFEVSISQDGIEYPAEVRPGKHTIGINFGEQPATGYEHLVGHNLQLVHLEEGYDQQLLDDLAAWIDWSDPEAFIDNAPAGVTFLGGSMEMSGGNKAYYTVNLKPGHYAWIAEVPNPMDKNMLKTFSVPFGRDVK